MSNLKEKPVSAKESDFWKPAWWPDNESDFFKPDWWPANPICKPDSAFFPRSTSEKEGVKKKETSEKEGVGRVRVEFLKKEAATMTDAAPVFSRSAPKLVDVGTLTDDYGIGEQFIYTIFVDGLPEAARNRLDLCIKIILFKI